ncbi:clathrin light chain-like [Dermacentor albipictus]|uniref:clathrin light chain-like n=1 Tax=Dermacentor albipictus TaxID=60249 RepID=UPI0038FCAB44
MDEFTPFETHHDSQQSSLLLQQHQKLDSSMDDLFNGPNLIGGGGGTSLEGDINLLEGSASQFPADLPPSCFSLDDMMNPDAPSRPPPVPKDEPETIRKWREEMQRHLKEKDAQEEVKKEELRLNAQRELSDWYARYNESVAKCRAANRSAMMSDWLPGGGARDGGPTPDRVPEWENIARLCDFNAKASRNAKDVSRMRAIILQLKQSPPPGALGVISPVISM